MPTIDLLALLRYTLVALDIRIYIFEIEKKIEINELLIWMRNINENTQKHENQIANFEIGFSMEKQRNM